jgi:putative DNA primase/helicase
MAWYQCNVKNGVNMSENLSQFIDALASAGCAPSRSGDIQATGKIIRFHIMGDKNGSRNGRCQLFEHGDGFAAGWFMNMREGEKRTWHSKATRKFTDEERREWVKKREADKKAYEAQKKADYAVAAEKAARIWERSKKAPHGYLTRKQATGKGTRVYKGVLVVPAYKAGKLVTLQFIAEDGQKRFLTGGEKIGAYGSMGTATDTIYICEGYATADAVHQATGKACIWAFDAGNLKDVAKAIRKKYQKSIIVIAGDNDQWTVKPDGTPNNVGVLKGRAAADEVGAVFICPEVPADDPDRRTDWNDLFVTEGLDYVRNSVANAVDRGVDAPDHSDIDVAVSIDSPPLDWLENAPPIEAYDQEARDQIDMYNSVQENAYVSEFDPEWRGKLHCNDEGKLTAKSLNNVQLILANSPKFRDMFCYDEFAHEKILVNCPDWEKPERFRPRPINDEDITWLAISLERQGLTLKMGEIKKVLEAVINKKRRNPAREYFNGLKWDGTERLKNWLIYYAGCEFDDLEYVQEVGTKWMVAAVSRVYEPGTKFDHVLIIEGDQGAGKSTMLRELATIRGKSYFDDTIKVSDLGSDKTIPKLQGVLIIELAEMAGMRKADVDNLKQQITIQEDRLVQKYKNEASRFPRQFVMAGTINPVQGYLDDPTGNRRFLPVRAGKKIDVEGIKRDREQLWAEAVYLYREKYPLWFGETLTKKLKEIQRSREIYSPWLQDIEEMCADRKFISNNDIWSELHIEKSKRTQRDLNEIGKVMVSLGYERVRRRIDGEREYGWIKKEAA